MSLNFLGGTKLEEADPNLLSDIKGLNSFNPVQLKSFITLVTDFLKEPTSTDILGNVSTFCDEHKVNSRLLKSMVRSSLLVFKGALRHNISNSQLERDLKQLELKSNNADIVSSSWKETRGVLFQTMLVQTLRVNKLIDMQWKFGVSASSDELRQISATFLQVQLTLSQGKGRVKIINMEMTLSQFYEFLAEMEKVKALMDYLVE